MSIRSILPITDFRLREQSLPVNDIDDNVRQLITDMLDTLADADGAGLAAVQVGILKRIVVANVLSGTPYAEHQVFINPEIIYSSLTTQRVSEGCLSMPEIYFEVERALEVHVQYTGIDGESLVIETSGFPAICFQHEIDHLNGIRHVDRVSALKRDRHLSKFVKNLKSAAYNR